MSNTVEAIFAQSSARYAALRCWRDCYVGGTRITHDGTRFIFEKCDGNPGVRLQKRLQYGVFILEPCEPSDAVQSGIRTHGDNLLHWLTMPVVEKYRDWFFNLVNKDYELEVLIAVCAQAGTAVNGTPLDGGWFAQVVDCPIDPARKKFIPNRFPPIMEGVYRYAEIEDHLAHNLESRMRDGSARQPSGSQSRAPALAARRANGNGTHWAAENPASEKVI